MLSFDDQLSANPGDRAAIREAKDESATEMPHLYTQGHRTDGGGVNDEHSTPNISLSHLGMGMGVAFTDLCHH